MSSTSLHQDSTAFEIRPPSIPGVDDPRNPANNVNFPVHGWPLLVNIMNQLPRLEAFANFRDLNIKSLLYYQAELIYLRKKLHRVEWNDSRQSQLEKSSSYADNLTFLIKAREHSDESAGSKNPVPLPEQWTLIERIRTTLDKYSKVYAPEIEL